MIDETLFRSEAGKESAVDQVVGRFRELIAQRKLRPGDLLPNESAIARQMGVSRGSVREAMKILGALGVVDVRRGDGTYVSGDIGRTILDPFLLRLMMSASDDRTLVEFREMIECDVVRAAVKHGAAEGFALMREAVERMERAPAGEDSPGLVALDIEFHRAMGRATGNALIEQLYEFILRFFEGSIGETYRAPGNPARALAYHRSILQALEAGDEAAALAAVHESIRGWAGEEERA